MLASGREAREEPAGDSKIEVALSQNRLALPY